MPATECAARRGTACRARKTAVIVYANNGVRRLCRGVLHTPSSCGHRRMYLVIDIAYQRLEAVVFSPFVRMHGHHIFTVRARHAVPLHDGDPICWQRSSPTLRAKDFWPLQGRSFPMSATQCAASVGARHAVPVPPWRSTHVQSSHSDHTRSRHSPFDLWGQIIIRPYDI